MDPPAWTKMAASALECDGWGQEVEACDAYEALEAALRRASNDASRPPETKGFLQKLSLACKLRIKALNDPAGRGISLSEMQPLKDMVARCLDVPPPALALDLSRYHRDQAEVLAPAPTSQDVGAVTTSFDDRSAMRDMEPSSSRSLLPQPPPFPNGGTAVSIRIEKIGLKKAVQYLDPFITVEWMDARGREVERSQDLPICRSRSEQYLDFDQVVHMQSPLENMPPGSAIFFSFRHFKPKKDKISTKGWSYINAEDIKQGARSLEIWKKPTDPSRRSTKRLSVKPLYLHVEFTLVKT